MFLENDIFSTVISKTPLVSIDLVVVNKQGKALLGMRLNKPAQGYWFVPGGRILKNESFDKAFSRLTLAELGTEFSIERATFQGSFTHLYDDSVFGDEISTHYVAIAYRLVVEDDELKLPFDEQHDRYQWFSQFELLSSQEVHLHTKWYFENYSLTPPPEL